MLVSELFPPEIWNKIYEYDPTYRKVMVDCHRQMKNLLAGLYEVLYCRQSDRLIRRLTKGEMVELCLFLKIRIPEKGITKKRLAQLLYCFTHGVLPSGLEAELVQS